MKDNKVFMKVFSNVKIQGAFLTILSALFLSITFSVARTLDSNIPTTMIVFVRTCFGLLFFIPFLFKYNLQIFRTSRLHIHIVRAFLVLAAMICSYYSYRNLPMAFATSVGMSGGLFITLLSRIILGEIIGVFKWILMIIGYLGVVIVIRPNSFSLEFAVITSLLANLFMALSIITAKILSRTDSNITIMLYTNILIVLISALSLEGDLNILTSKDLIKLFIIGFLGVSSQSIMLIALKLTSASFIAPFEYIRIVFSTLIGITVFAEIPDLWTILGTIVIIATTYSITYYEYYVKKDSEYY